VSSRTSKQRRGCPPSGRPGGERSTSAPGPVGAVGPGSGRGTWERTPPHSLLSHLSISARPICPNGPLGRRCVPGDAMARPRSEDRRLSRGSARLAAGTRSGQDRMRALRHPGDERLPRLPGARVPAQVRAGATTRSADLVKGSAGCRCTGQPPRWPRPMTSQQDEGRPTMGGPPPGQSRSCPRKDSAPLSPKSCPATCQRACRKRVNRSRPMTLRTGGRPTHSGGREAAPLSPNRALRLRDAPDPKRSGLARGVRFLSPMGVISIDSSRLSGIGR
jgi:hypothetical protein